MIKEAYCSYEVSKLLKERGFNEKIYSFYKEKKNKPLYIESYSSEWNNKYLHLGHISAPTHQMACAWLREVHKVLIVIDAYHADHWDGYIDSFEIRIYSHASTIIVPNEIVHHTDYTEAVETAIKYSLENLL